MGIILKPFAWLLLFFYNFFNSYGLALILFAVVIKLILFPVTLKSKKSMIQTTMLSGKMQQLQKQYGKDKERYNAEIQKLYEREHVNPMGGCLWSLIPMILLLLLYAIIREPMTHFMDLSVEQIQTIADKLDWPTVAVANGWVAQGTMDKLRGQLAEGKITSLFQNVGFNQIYLVSLINEMNLPSLQAAIGDSGLFIMDFSFLGLDLSAIPTWKFRTKGISPSSIGMFMIPIVSVASSYLSMKVSMATNKINQQTQNASVDQTNRMMMLTMPLMSLWIGFTVPAGLSVYWITQYIISMGQEVICSKLLKKDYEAARVAAEERERQEKEEEKRRREEARLERQRRIEEEKKNKGKKKPAAKRAEPTPDGVNREDSREGIRAYARGRAYVPGRFGGVTPYVDPNGPACAGTGDGQKRKEEPEQEPVLDKIPVEESAGGSEPAALTEDVAGEDETGEKEEE